MTRGVDVGDRLAPAASILAMSTSDLAAIRSLAKTSAGSAHPTEPAEDRPLGQQPDREVPFTWNGAPHMAERDLGTPHSPQPEHFRLINTASVSLR